MIQTDKSQDGWNNNNSTIAISIEDRWADVVVVAIDNELSMKKSTKSVAIME